MKNIKSVLMLEFYFDFIDKYIDRSDFELLEMDTDSNYFIFSIDFEKRLQRVHRITYHHILQNSDSHSQTTPIPSRTTSPHATPRAHSTIPQVKSLKARQRRQASQQRRAAPRPQVAVPAARFAWHHQASSPAHACAAVQAAYNQHEACGTPCPA
jgi:hypothetical protein